MNKKRQHKKTTHSESWDVPEDIFDECAAPRSRFIRHSNSHGSDIGLTDGEGDTITIFVDSDAGLD